MSVAVASGAGSLQLGGESAVHSGQVTPSSQERMQQVRQEANQYIDRHNLRHVMQDLFQRLVKERPSDPAEFMRQVLAPNADTAQEAEHRALQARNEELRHEVVGLRERLLEAERVAAAAREGQQAAEAHARKASAESIAGSNDVGSQPQWEQRYKVEVAKQKATIEELEAQVKGLQDAGAQEARVSQRVELERRLESEQTKVQVLNLRVQELESAVSSPGNAGLLVAPGQAAKMAAGSQLAATASTAVPSSAAIMQFHSSTQAVSEVNTHMLSQFMYNGPGLASTYVMPGESLMHESGDFVGANPNVLVEVVDCSDPLSNGVYAWAGTCNLRPIFRLLGPEPRYLHWEDGDGMAGWQIVNRMGADREPVERFRRPADAMLPVHCEPGDRGSRALDAKLSVEVLGKISFVSNTDEKVAIRGRLSDAYGAAFTRMEAQSRGLMTRASPVVAVAHTLEAQQRTIQLLGGRLASEAKRREAAEAQFRTLEEAFETLQLRIQAQLPPPATFPALVQVQQENRAAHAPALADDVRVEGTTAFALPTMPAPATQGQVAGLPPPAPHPPISPKEVKPGLPTFRRPGQRALQDTDGAPAPSALAGGPGGPGQTASPAPSATSGGPGGPGQTAS